NGDRAATARTASHHGRDRSGFHREYPPRLSCFAKLTGALVAPRVENSVGLRPSPRDRGGACRPPLTRRLIPPFRFLARLASISPVHAAIRRSARSLSCSRSSRLSAALRQRRTPNQCPALRRAQCGAALGETHSESHDFCTKQDCGSVR